MPSHHDSAGRPIVVVTGMGVVTSLGAGKAENWKNLTAGKSGIKNITRFATEGLKTRFAGTLDFVPAEPLSSPELSERLADLAAEEAVSESGIGSRGDFPGPLFIAVPPIEIEWDQRRQVATASGANANVSYTDLIRTAAAGKFTPFHERFMFGSVANHLADKYGTKGSPISLSTACASGATAIQLGVEAIRRGETSAALCIGSDGSINVESLIRFSLLSALSTSADPPEQAAKPFAKNRDGFVMAEGAGALVLESLESATARGAKILGVMNGCGEMADAFHRTRSSPDGKPIIGCIRNALADAGLTPDDIDYINPHGTGTPENDKMEAMGVMAVFGERAKTLPMSSNKSMVGHTLSAAGAVEAVFSLLSALSTQNDPPQATSKPFSKNRDGFVIAEGAGALVLESLDHALARGAKVLGIIEGCGEKSDSFHRTRSSPDGKPVISCMRNALANAGLEPDQIDYINAHGTSTPENDKMEYLGVSTVFGERIKDIPISSNKSMIGHTLTAAGAIEAIVSLLTLEHQRIPPTINYQVPDPAIPLDVVPNKARDAKVTHAISNSFGFGGQNVSLVMAREVA